MYYYAIWPAILLGSLVNKYKQTKEVKPDELFIYFDFELPEDKDCDDIENKKKWLHKYRRA